VVKAPEDVRVLATKLVEDGAYLREVPLQRLRDEQLERWRERPELSEELGSKLLRDSLSPKLVPNLAAHWDPPSFASIAALTHADRVTPSASAATSTRAASSGVTEAPSMTARRRWLPDLDFFASVILNSPRARRPCRRRKTPTVW